MNFDQWRSQLKQAAKKAVEQLNFDEMARNDEYVHQEGLNVVRKNEKNHTSKQHQSSVVMSTATATATKTQSVPPSSSTPSITSSTRSVASMRQHSSLGSIPSDDDSRNEEIGTLLPKTARRPIHNSDMDDENNNENDNEEEEEEYVSRKNKLRFLEDLDHRLSKPNRELELPLYTTTRQSSTAHTASSSPLKKQPLWAKPARSSVPINTKEDETPLIITTTKSTAVLDDTELQALATLQQQSSISSSTFVLPSFLLSWCTARIPLIRQYPKSTGLVFLLILLYVLRLYSRLVVPVEGVTDESV